MSASLSPICMHKHALHGKVMTSDLSLPFDLLACGVAEEQHFVAAVGRSLLISAERSRETAVVRTRVSKTAPKGGGSGQLERVGVG